jgi:stearoyl-CoA desaturase (delta-9 desaturase)
MLLPQWLNYFIVFCGTLACQNGPLKWVAQHRMHHKGSDTDDDPHNARHGFWWSHIGWMCYTRHKFDNVNRMRKYTQDINRDKFYQFLDEYFIHIQIALGIIFYLIGGISWVVWGIFVRLVLVYHVTWFVNSACHMWGYTNYNINDLSKNNWWVALLTFGEGWHSNHHKHSKRYTTKVKWWELDLTGIIIKALLKLNIINSIKSY